MQIKGFTMKYTNLALLFMIAVVSLLSGCVTSSFVGITPEQWKSATSEQRKCWIREYNAYKKAHPEFKGDPNAANKIKLQISGGTAVFPPKFLAQPYRSIKLTLPDGSCYREPVYAKSGTLQTKLYVCYDKNTLAIDPSHYDNSTTNGSLILTFNPLWGQGFTYNNMNSDGYVKLKNVDIAIKQQS